MVQMMSALVRRNECNWWQLLIYVLGRCDSWKSLKAKRPHPNNRNKQIKITTTTIYKKKNKSRKKEEKMATQLRCSSSSYLMNTAPPLPQLPFIIRKKPRNSAFGLNRRRENHRSSLVVVVNSSSSSSSGGAGNSAAAWESWKPEKVTPGSPPLPSLSEVLWPSVGAFAAMAILGKMDQLLAPRGISVTIAPLGAVCAVLFATPSSAAARKYNMFMAQIGCAAIGVLALTIFGPGWLARSAALAASIAFMIYTRSTHPPAASLPLLFIDGAKLHHLNFWYAVFPGATGCIILCLIQEIVCYLKDNFKF